MSIEFKLDGFSQLNRMLEQLPDNVENKVLQGACTDAMKSVLPDFQGMAPQHETDKQSPASHEYGSILANLHVENKKNVKKGQKGAIITTGNAFWAYFYHFGTRHQPARRWFIFSAVIDKVLDRLKESLGDGIEKEATKLGGGG